MKKYLILLLLAGCGYAPIDNLKHGIIITDIESASAGGCNYFGQGNGWLVGTITSQQFKFKDSCGKFQIGDTVNLIKN